MAARVRIWGEAAVAAASAVLFVLALGWPNWIEAVFGVDPDRHNGFLEWLLAAACAGIAVGMSLRVRRAHALRLLDAEAGGS